MTLNALSSVELMSQVLIGDPIANTTTIEGWDELSDLILMS